MGYLKGSGITYNLTGQELYWTHLWSDTQVWSFIDDIPCEGICKTLVQDIHSSLCLQTTDGLRPHTFQRHASTINFLAPSSVCTVYSIADVIKGQLLILSVSISLRAAKPIGSFWLLEAIYSALTTKAYLCSHSKIIPLLGTLWEKSPSQFRWPTIQQILFFGCATQHAGSSFLGPGIKPVLPALSTWSLNHWTVRKIPNRHLFWCLLETPWSKLCTHLLCSVVSGPMMAVSYPGSSGTKCCLFQRHDMPCEQQLLDAYSTLL